MSSKHGTGHLVRNRKAPVTGQCSGNCATAASSASRLVGSAWPYKASLRVLSVKALFTCCTSGKGCGGHGRAPHMPRKQRPTVFKPQRPHRPSWHRARGLRALSFEARAKQFSLRTVRTDNHSKHKHTALHCPSCTSVEDMVQLGQGWGVALPPACDPNLPNTSLLSVPLQASLLHARAGSGMA